MAEPEKVALVDMDGTLVDYAGQMRRDLAALAGPDDPPWQDFSDDTPPHIRRRCDMIKRQPGWWLNLPDFPLGHDALRVCRDVGFDIHVLTKGPYRTTSAWTEKVEWCRTHLPDDVKVTITEDKGLVYGRVLVDDYPDYLARWLEWRPRGIGIMPAHPYNAGFRHERVIRYDGRNMAEVAAALRAAFDRAAGE